MDSYIHTLVNLGFWVAIVFPLGPIIGTGDLPIFIFLWSLLVVIGGSKIPDIDHPHAKIHHVPILGKFINKFVINPLKRSIGELNHRGFVHSLPGMALISALLFVYLFIGSMIIGIILLVIIEPLSYNLLYLSVLGFWATVERVPINSSYLVRFYIVSIVAFIFGFVVHLWLDYHSVQGIRWVRFWMDPPYDGYISQDTGNKIRATHFFLSMPLIILILELLFIKSIGPLFWMFLCLNIGSIVLTGLLLKSPWIIERLFLAEVCPDCKKRGENGLLILRTRRKDGVEFFGCSNYRKTGCTFTRDAIASNFDHSEKDPISRVGIALNLMFFFSVLFGVPIHEIFLIIGLGFFFIDTFRHFRREKILDFWKETQ